MSKQDSESSFARDIRPMFRQNDINEMKEIADFDLSDYRDVLDRANNIYARLVDGTMPCDGAWSEEKVEQFKRWMDEGLKP